MHEIFIHHQSVIQFIVYCLAAFGAYKALEALVPLGIRYARNHWQIIGIALCLGIAVWSAFNREAFGATANALRGPETDPFLVPGEWQMCLVSCLVVSALLVLMARAAKKEHRHLAEIIGFPAAGGLAMALVCSLSSDQMYHVNGWIVLVVGLIAGPVVWFDWPAIYCRFRAWFAGKGSWRWLLRGAVKGFIIYLASCQITQTIECASDLGHEITLAVSGLGLLIAGRC